MGDCTWFSLQTVQLVGKSEQGELYAVAQKMWSSHHPDDYKKPAPRTNEHIYSNFIFCSKSNPAIFDYQTSGATESGPREWNMGTLKPGREDAVYGYNTLGYVAYMAVCHNNTNVELATTSKFGKQLGYSFSDGELNDHKVASPFDVVR